MCISFSEEHDILVTDAVKQSPYAPKILALTHTTKLHFKTTSGHMLTPQSSNIICTNFFNELRNPFNKLPAGTKYATRSNRSNPPPQPRIPPRFRLLPCPSRHHCGAHAVRARKSRPPFSFTWTRGAKTAFSETSPAILASKSARCNPQQQRL